MSSRELKGSSVRYDKNTFKNSINCLKWVLKKTDDKPDELWVDDGRMFISKAFKKFVKSVGIHIHYIDKG